MRTVRFQCLLCLLAFATFELFVGSCKDSNNPVGSGSGKSLTVRPESLTVGIMEIAYSTISGGTKPYFISSNSDTSKVGAYLTDSTVYIGGLSPGRATIVVRDSPGTSTGSLHVHVDTSATPPQAGSLTFYPSYLSLNVGDIASSYIIDGTSPYTLENSPDPLVAIVSVIGSSVTVTGVGVGSTSVVMRDMSSPARRGILPITVTAGGCTLDVAGSWSGTYTFTSGNMSGQTFDASASLTGSGASLSGTFKDVSHNIIWNLSSFTCSGTSFSAVFNNVSIGKLNVDGTLSGNLMSGTFSDAYGGGTFSLTRSGGGTTTGGSISFNSDKGNFAATGDYDSTHFVTNVGAFSFADGGMYYLVIVAIHVVSSTQYQTAGLLFSNTSPISTGTYSSFPKYFSLSYGPSMSVLDTATTLYLVMTGSAAISSLTSSTAQGTFAGTGYNDANSSDLITVTGGTFNVTYVNESLWGSPSSVALGKEAGKIVRALMREKKR